MNNREGGVLYIGIGDEGCPVANSDIDSMQLKIADRIKHNILPSTLGLFDIIIEYYREYRINRLSGYGLYGNASGLSVHTEPDSDKFLWHDRLRGSFHRHYLFRDYVCGGISLSELADSGGKK